MREQIENYHLRLRKPWFWCLFFSVNSFICVISHFGQLPNKVAYLSSLVVGLIGPFLVEAAMGAWALLGRLFEALGQIFRSIWDWLEKWWILSTYRFFRSRSLSRLQVDLRDMGFGEMLISEITSLLVKENIAKSLGKIADLAAAGKITNDQYEQLYKALSNYSAILSRARRYAKYVND